MQKLLVEDAIRKILQEKVNRAKAAMDEAQSAANEEVKSSAGDKYETARAMAQNLRNMNARQCADALIMLENFEKNTQKSSHIEVGAGSLVQTEAGLFYMGPGIGKIELTNFGTIWALSLQSPMGKALWGKKLKDKVEWMGKSIQILSIS